MGTGKQLTFGLSASRSDNKSDNISGSWYFDQFQFSNTKHNAEHTAYGLSLSYYDPHLFDSTDYFLQTTVGYNKGKSKSQNIDVELDQVTFDNTSRGSNTNYNVKLGRRFGSHSYVSLLYADVNTQSNSGAWELAYGWDTQDDGLFPTRGSVFTSTLSTHHFSDGLNVNYKQHFALKANNIVTVGFFGGYNKDDDFRSSHDTHGRISARYTQINPLDKVNGIYAGWFTELSLSKASDSDDHGSHGLGLRAGYTYQTDSMVYRFTLSYNKSEAK
ncbi:MAG: outer membrane protein assembly factor BamA [Phenylobacterium sp.]